MLSVISQTNQFPTNLAIEAIKLPEDKLEDLKGTSRKLVGSAVFIPNALIASLFHLITLVASFSYCGYKMLSGSKHIFDSYNPIPCEIIKISSFSSDKDDFYLSNSSILKENQFLIPLERKLELLGESIYTLVGNIVRIPLFLIHGFFHLITMPFSLIHFAYVEISGHDFFDSNTKDANPTSINDTGRLITYQNKTTRKKVAIVARTIIAGIYVTAICLTVSSPLLKNLLWRSAFIGIKENFIKQISVVCGVSALVLGSSFLVQRIAAGSVSAEERYPIPQQRPRVLQQRYPNPQQRPRVLQQRPRGLEQSSVPSFIQERYEDLRQRHIALQQNSAPHSIRANKECIICKESLLDSQEKVAHITMENGTQIQHVYHKACQQGWRDECCTCKVQNPVWTQIESRV